MAGLSWQLNLRLLRVGAIQRDGAANQRDQVSPEALREVGRYYLAASGRRLQHFDLDELVAEERIICGHDEFLRDTLLAHLQDGLERMREGT